MKKTDQRITKRGFIDEKPMRSPVINDDVCGVVEELGGKPNHNPHPNPDPCPPVPPKPVPPKPQPTNVVFGDGLVVNGNVVSVKIDDKQCGEYLVVTKHGISIEPLLRKLEKMTRMLVSIEKRLTDVESDINKLKSQTKPESLSKIIVGKSKSFEIADDGKISIKTNNGICVADDGNLQVNGNDTISIDESGKMGVDYDVDTLGLVGDGDDKKLATVIADWETGGWNN